MPTIQGINDSAAALTVHLETDWRDSQTRGARIQRNAWICTFRPHREIERERVESKEEGQQKRQEPKHNQNELQNIASLMSTYILRLEIARDFFKEKCKRTCHRNLSPCLDEECCWLTFLHYFCFCLGTEAWQMRLQDINPFSEVDKVTDNELCRESTANRHNW